MHCGTCCSAGYVPTYGVPCLAVVVLGGALAAFQPTTKRGNRIRLSSDPPRPELPVTQIPIPEL